MRDAAGAVVLGYKKSCGCWLGGGAMEEACEAATCEGSTYYYLGKAS